MEYTINDNSLIERITTVYNACEKEHSDELEEINGLFVQYNLENLISDDHCIVPIENIKHNFSDFINITNN